MPKRSPKVHRVKSWVHLFQPLWRGEKTHDIRVLDRDYEVGDTLVLCEYDKQQEDFTEREVMAEITYITSDKHVACAFSPIALKSGYGVLSIKVIGTRDVGDSGSVPGPVGGNSSFAGSFTPIPNGEALVMSPVPFRKGLL